MHTARFISSVLQQAWGQLLFWLGIHPDMSMNMRSSILVPISLRYYPKRKSSRRRRPMIG